MDSSRNVKFVRDLVQKLDDAERTLGKFKEEIPVRRDALIRRVESAREAISNAMTRPTSPAVADSCQLPLVAELKKLRFRLPDGHRVR